MPEWLSEMTWPSAIFLSVCVLAIAWVLVRLDD